MLLVTQGILSTMSCSFSLKQGSKILYDPRFYRYNTYPPTSWKPANVLTTGNIEIKQTVKLKRPTIHGVHARGSAGVAQLVERRA